MDPNVSEAERRSGLSPERMRRLRALHESLARQFGAALGELLRAGVEVRLRAVEQTSYGQFVRRAALPACFYLLRVGPMDERWMLDFEPSVLHRMIDDLLGGGRGDDPPPERPLTEIESCLAARIVRVFLQQCRQAWQGGGDLELEILQVDENPQSSRILPADEAVLVADFGLMIEASQGLMRLCIPIRAIERMGEPPPASAAQKTAAGAMAKVEATLAETRITAGELSDLRVGDIIATETPADSPVVVSIDGAAKFRAKPGAYHGRKAVRLLTPIEKSTPEP